MKKLVLALLATVLGGLLLKVAESPLDRWLKGNQLEVHAVIGPHVPNPESSEVKMMKKASDLDLDNNAVITIFNHGNTKAEQIKIRFNREDTLSFIAYYSVDGKIVQFKQGFQDGGSFPVPSLLPGDELKIYMVASTYDLRDVFEQLSVHSSVGGATVSWQGDIAGGRAWVPHSFLAHIWHWSFYIILGFACLAALIALFETSMYAKFVRLLFTHDDFYLTERMKYERAPRKYTLPQTELASMPDPLQSHPTEGEE